MKILHSVAFTLVLVGAVNWGLVGLFNYNLINVFLSSVPGVEKLVYIVVGVAAVWLAVRHGQDCRTCTEGKAVSPS